MPKYIQTKNLRTVFDLSPDYFKKRMNKEFIKGKHFFIPPTDSKTKHIVLWNVEALESWLTCNENDKELASLLQRR